MPIPRTDHEIPILNEGDADHLDRHGTMRRNLAIRVDRLQDEALVASARGSTDGAPPMTPIRDVPKR
ncbi:MAG TPA: hypothetical protein VM889_10225 [Candidatus Thermoplasmatota archaeon]|nr:hypothetical protein [Candidatus Thermoplasmatota archaeon]